MNRKSAVFVCLFAAHSFLNAAPPDIRATAARMPLHFEATPDNRLVARQGPYRLDVEAGRTTVTVTDRARKRSGTVTTRLVGANRASRPVGEEPLAARASYFLGSDPANWRSSVPLFGRAVQHDIYPGIDLVFHGDSGSLEYDFLVHGGASAGRIALDIGGASAVRIEPDGALALATPAGEIHWKRPEVYQWKDGVRQPVKGAFALHGHRVTFALGAYDRARDLVIDPTLAYASYFGGNDNDSGRGIAVDSSGNFYLTGFAYSMNLPVTAGSVQTAFHGAGQGEIGGDAFVAKFTAAGALAYVTYLGGSSDDAGAAIAVDSSGSAYITGFTNSTNFPTVKGSFQTTFGGQSSGSLYQQFGDAFVAKLNPAGSALVYSTYLGGSKDEQGTAIAVDSSGNAYVGGATLSSNFPTLSPYQAANAGAGGSPAFCCGSPAPFISFGDGFVAKLNPAGTALLFSTYLGGELDDAVTALALDSSNNVYVGGSTLSTKFPVLNAYQNKFGGAANATAQPVITVGDGFVAKFDTTGKLQYSTYLGGSGDDGVMGIAVDSAGAAYVTGFTSSANFPAGASSAQKSFSGPATITNQRGFVWGDAFVAKLAPSGSSLAWATYLGGTADDAGMAIAVDPGGNAIVGGFSSSTNLPVTTNALQKTFAGIGPSFFTDPTGDAFLAQVSADGAKFQYLSYYGGSASEAITGLALDTKGNVIVSGSTTSPDLPVTTGAAQKSFGGQSAATQTEDLGDAFVAVFSGVATLVTATPVITGVSNGGSQTSALAPGSAAAIFGTNLPTSASAGVLVGGQSATVTLATATQWTIVIPYSIPPGPTTVQVGTSAPFSITVTQYAPALFSTTGNLAVAQRILSGSSPVVSAAAPALPGDYVMLFATGLGVVDAAGNAIPVPSVTLGGTSVTVFSAIASTANPGSYQVTIQIPPTTAAGNPAVVLSIGGLSSQSLTLPIGALASFVVTNVENAASFLAGFSQGSWTTITGNGLSGTTRIWTDADFNGNNLPTQLDQVSVTIDGKPAYVYFVSPNQINVLAPADTATGPVQVQVTYAGHTSNSVSASLASFAPALFTYSPQGGKYVAAVRPGDSAYLGPAGLYAGLTTLPAHAGDLIELFGTGFGPTNPTTSFGQIISGAPPTANTVTATIGGVTAVVQFAGLVTSGEYQFNIYVPAGLPAGDNLVVLKVNGVSTQANVYLTVQ